MGVIGTFLKKYRNVKTANYMLKLNLCFIIGFIIIELLCFYFGDVYLKDLSTKLEDGTTTDNLYKTGTIILLFITIVIIIVGVICCFCCRKAYKTYYNSIKDYNNFLLNYNETPRSKLIKKYKAPLEPLFEASVRQEAALSSMSYRQPS